MKPSHSSRVPYLQHVRVRLAEDMLGTAGQNITNLQLHARPIDLYRSHYPINPCAEVSFHSCMHVVTAMRRRRMSRDRVDLPMVQIKEGAKSRSGSANRFIREVLEPVPAIQGIRCRDMDMWCIIMINSLNDAPSTHTPVSYTRLTLPTKRIV